MRWRLEVTEGFTDWWRELSVNEQDDILASAMLLSEWGPYPRFPHTAWINQSRHRNMREMRIRSGGSPFRLIYAFDPKRVTVVLVGGEKGSRQPRYPQLVSRVDRHYDSHLLAVESAEQSP